MAADRGLWLEKFDDPTRVVTSEEVEAWKPLVEGEKAARRAADLLGLLTAGADSEIMSLRTPEAKRLRRSYGVLWRSWKTLDEKRDHRWALNDVVIEIDGAAFRRAREFDLGDWIGTEVPRIRIQAVVGVRATLALGDTRARRAERKVMNEIITIINNEVVLIDWSL